MPRASATLVLMLLGGFLAGFSNGPPAGFSGAPGENTCVVCHAQFPLNAGPELVVVTGPESFAHLGTVPLWVSFPGSSGPRHGFQLTARTGAGSFGGQWTPQNPPPPALPRTQVQSSNWVAHTAAGTYGAPQWAVLWTPPVPPVQGPVTFHAAGNAADGTGGTNGDRISTATFTSYQASLVTAGSWPQGSLQALYLDAPGHAGEAYAIALSRGLGPTSFGSPFLLPVDAWDPLVFVPWSTPGIFTNWVGVLDAQGSAIALVAVPTLLPGLSGQTLHVAAATVAAGGVVSEVSNRRTILIP
jgi:hypothetical protein